MTRKFEDSKAPWAPKIPVGWKAIRNKFLLIGSYSGGTPAATNPRFYNDEGIPFISIADMSNVDYVEKTEKHVTEAGMTDKNLQIVPRGSVIYSMYATVGHVAETKIDATISQAMIALYLSEKYDKAYYKYSLQAIRDYIFGSAEGTTQMNLNAQKVYEMFLLQPPIPEQQSIVSYLDKKCAAIDEAIARRKKIIEKLYEFRMSKIADLVLMKDRNSRYETDNPYFKSMPVGVKISSIRRHFSVKLGKMLCSEARTEDDSLEQYYCAADVHFDGINYSDLKQMWFSTKEKAQYLVKNGDMLIVEGGAGAGGSYVVSEQKTPTYIQNSILRIRGTKSGSVRYLKYLVEYLVKNGYIAYACNTATFSHFTNDKVSDTPFPAIDLDEQEKIADKLDAIDMQINEMVSGYQKIIEKLEEYRKSIIYNAVTGKIDCREVV